jgi:hypothetical protein
MKKQSLMILAYLAAVGLTAPLVGCRAVGALLAPDSRVTVPAEYTLEKKKKIAVFIDDYLSPISDRQAKKDLAQKIGLNLTEMGAIRPGDLVETDKVFEVTTENAEGKKVSLQHIGKEVTADFVIYVNIIEFNLQSDPENPLIKPRAKAYVKVIDVSDGERAWPVDLAGRLVEKETRGGTELASEVEDKLTWSQSLIDELSVDISELFVDHKEGS